MGPHEGATLHATMEILKATKLVDVVNTKRMIRSLQKAFPFVDDFTERLIGERDCYRITANRTDATYDLLAFWDNRLRLPTWYSVA